MINQALAKILFEIAHLLELDEDNPFRIRAFERAAQTLENYPQNLSNLNRNELLAIPGIGKGIADIIEEFGKTGKVKEHERLIKKFPPGLLEIMHLPGLGPKRAAVLFKRLKIDSVEKLARAAQSASLQKIPGFGERIEANILKGISFIQSSSKRILITEALEQANDIEAHLCTSPHTQQLELAGSARRWKETVGDLDFLCTSQSPEKVISHFLTYSKIERVLASGDTKASVILKNGMQCDVRVVDPLVYGAALLYFTGSKEHNVRLRELALKLGLTLSEYGLFKMSDKTKKKPVASKTEEDVYKHLGLPWIPPELREDRGEVEAGLKARLPKLVTEEDVLGDFHNHTNLSDGAQSLEEMVQAAERMGWTWFFSADHSPSLKIASGLSIETLRKKMARIKQLDKDTLKMRVFSSSEVDILSDGQMDYPDDVLSDLDCVVASVHSRFNQSEDEMTGRLVKAIKNPHVDILGHISGRLIHRRESYQINYETVLQTAKETMTAVEINGQPQRQELGDVHVKRAVELGVPLALTTDAHSVMELNHMKLAVHIARRGWAEARHVLNSIPANELLHWLKQ